MKRQQWGWYLVALAIVLVGLVWAGVPVSTVLIFAAVLCPLMMVFMMHGMNHGHLAQHDSPDHDGGRRSGGEK